MLPLACVHTRYTVAQLISISSDSRVKTIYKYCKNNSVQECWLWRFELELLSRGKSKPYQTSLTILESANWKGLFHCCLFSAKPVLCTQPLRIVYWEPLSDAPDVYSINKCSFITSQYQSDNIGVSVMLLLYFPIVVCLANRWLKRVFGTRSREWIRLVTFECICIIPPETKLTLT